MKPINITQVLYSGLGGHGNVAFSLVENDLNKLKNSFLFFGIEEVKPEYSYKCEKLNIVYKSILKIQGSHIKSWINAYKLLKELQSDVVILHSISLIIPAFLYGLFKSKKIIAVEHNANAIKRKSEWLWSVFAMILANKVVYLTPIYKEEVQQKIKFFFKEKKAEIIPNGLDTNIYAPVLKNPSPIIKLGMVSRMNKLRDHTTLILAFKELLAKLPNHQLKLFIAGDGDTYESAVRLTQELHLEDKIIFTGMLNENELLELFKSIDIYVHTTLAETMSTSLMQALSFGLPIVSSDISGVKNLISNNETGILVENKDKTILANALADLIANKELQKKLGENARKFAVSNLSNSVMFNKYLKLINQ